MAKTTKGLKKTANAKGAAGKKESAAKEAQGEPITVGRMLQSVKDRLAKLPGLTQAGAKAKAKPKTLAKTKPAAKPKEAAKTKAPTLRQTINAEKGSANEKGGFSDRAENADLRAETKPIIRGNPATMPLNDTNRHH